MNPKKDPGFTLIELLIVLGIIGLLLQLLLPAVEMSREAARRTQCLNNLKQLALGCQLHEQSHGHLPTGGWGWEWVGDPDRGFGKEQPGGWHYSILPYVEEQSLHDLGAGQGVTEKRAAAAAVSSTVRKGINCPSLRKGGLFVPRPKSRRGSGFSGINSENTPKGTVRSDYAMNGGKLPFFFREPHQFLRSDTLPQSYEEGDDAAFPWPEPYYNTGVCFIHSPVKLAQITDGLTKTYLIGEKSLSLNFAKGEGKAIGDNASAYQGYGFSTVRWAGAMPPNPEYDRENLEKRLKLSTPAHNKTRYRAFGSVHLSGFNMAMCDGSVHHVRFDIDTSVHEALATRSESEVFEWPTGE